ncbi:MAG: hypothetical protein R6U40_08215, partial [Desulfobacterales bacterium]
LQPEPLRQFYQFRQPGHTNESMKVKMVPTRNGFGDAIAALGESKDTIAFGADITGSIRMDKFYENHPERKERFFQMGIAEQNMTLAAAGFAKEGKTSFIGSYGVFVTGRNWEQIRTTLCYNNFNVKIANAHGGLSVGPDGATHQALEEISNPTAKAINARAISFRKRSLGNACSSISPSTSGPEISPITKNPVIIGNFILRKTPASCPEATATMPNANR